MRSKAMQLHRVKAQGRTNTMLTVKKLRVDDEDDKQKRKHGSHDDDPMRWELENYPFFRFFTELLLLFSSEH